MVLCVISSGLLEGVEVPDGAPRLRIEADAKKVGVPFLSWDTEGGNRASMNLLCAPLVPSLRLSGEWVSASDLEFELVTSSESVTEYRLPLKETASVSWRVIKRDSSASFDFEVVHPADAQLEAIRLTFPFDPRAAATTVLPTDWCGENQMLLPAILSAPDFGQMLVACPDGTQPVGSLCGVREGEHKIDFHLEWTVKSGENLTLHLDPIRLPRPPGMTDEALWHGIRRGWFNMLQPSAQWGSPGRPQYAPPGLLANNVVSDPVSCVLHMKADHVLLVPELAPGVSAHVLLRNTLDWWLDNGIEESGEMRSWRQVRGMLDANAGPLISAWCYVEASENTDWLRRRIPDLERLADYLANRDIDNDGLVESVYSGNYGTQVGRLGASAYDTINSGHKDAYCNALIYRAWRCLADLENQLGQTEKGKRYSQLADRLKAEYQQKFYNPETGWLAWWWSEDGEIHDLHSPMITSIAILYGLVDLDSGRSMLAKLWEKIDSVGFTRFDLGVPLTLEPVRKGDYRLPKPGQKPGKYGMPEREDGSDTFQQYLNGGCCVSDAYYFITALSMVGEKEKADRILKAMLKRQVEGVFPNGGGFQNGVVDRYPDGAEFYGWQGTTYGYEGHLVYSFSFLQSVFLREACFREIVLRPLGNR